MEEIFVEVVVKGNSDQLDIVLAMVAEAFDMEGVEEENGYLKFYFKQAGFNESEFHLLFKEYDIDYSISTLYNKNWNEIWESGFQPVVVGEFAAIRADFHAPVTTVTHELIITPKMSFGTGHHATTHMMIQMLEIFNPSGKTVIDFGTGTGVLAILAAKMEAAAVLAIDYDPWSIANAAENFEKNNVANITLLQADKFTGNASPANMVLANINRHVIIDNLAAIASGLTPGGLFILSGILISDVADLQELTEGFGFTQRKLLTQNNWAGMAFVKN